MDLNDLLAFDADESARYERIAEYLRKMGITGGFELSFGKDGVTIKHPALAQVDQLRGLVRGDKVNVLEVAERRDAMSQILDEGF